MNYLRCITTHAILLFCHCERLSVILGLVCQVAETINVFKKFVKVLLLFIMSYAQLVGFLQSMPGRSSMYCTLDSDNFPFS